MVTCKKRECKKRSNLDADGFCADHRNNDNSEETTDTPQCGQCKEDVPDNSETKAICCDVEDCKLWYHLDCINMTEALYELLMTGDEDNGVRWLCPKCCNNNSVIKLIEPSANQTPLTICNRFRHGSCPHGISGKTLFKGKACEFSHPKVCKKYIKNGPGGRYGCKLSDSE